MLYSGYGLTLPCFAKGSFYTKLLFLHLFILQCKGEKCIEELVERFNPKDVSNDGELSIHCNNLIN